MNEKNKFYHTIISLIIFFILVFSINYRFIFGIISSLIVIYFILIKIIINNYKNIKSNNKLILRLKNIKIITEVILIVLSIIMISHTFRLINSNIPRISYYVDIGTMLLIINFIIISLNIILHYVLLRLIKKEVLSNEKET